MNEAVRLKALVVEDDALQRELLTDLLSDAHVEVIQCESAEVAEALLDEGGSELRLLVTDVQLAGKETGVELAVYAKDHFPNLNVVVVSGQDGLALPPEVHFLHKPFQPLDLLREAITPRPDLPLASRGHS